MGARLNILTTCFLQDIHKLREEMKEKEAIKEAEARRRGKITSELSTQFVTETCLLEKAEDAKARAAIKAQIEADKKARAEKAAREKALRDGQAVPQAATPVASASTPLAASTGPKEYKETRLQLRLEGVPAPLTTTLSSDSRKHHSQFSFHSDARKSTLCSRRICRESESRLQCEYPRSYADFPKVPGNFYPVFILLYIVPENASIVQIFPNLSKNSGLLLLRQVQVTFVTPI